MHAWRGDDRRRAGTTPAPVPDRVAPGVAPRSGIDQLIALQQTTGNAMVARFLEGEADQALTTGEQTPAPAPPPTDGLDTERRSRPQVRQEEAEADDSDKVEQDRRLRG